MCVYARMCVCVTENISIFKKIWPSEKNSWILYLRFKDNLSKNNCNFLQGIEKKNISFLWLYNNSNFSKISKNPFVESRYKKNVPNVIIICREIGGSLESFFFFFFSLYNLWIFMKTGMRLDTTRSFILSLAPLMEHFWIFHFSILRNGCTQYFITFSGFCYSDGRTRFNGIKHSTYCKKCNIRSARKAWKIVPI